MKTNGGEKTTKKKGGKTGAKSREERSHEKRNATVRRKIREYFAQCDEEGKKYTQPGLQVALGVDEKTLAEWSRDRYLGADMELARAKIRDALEQREDQMAVYLRRQDSAARGEGAPELTVYFEREEDLAEYGA